MSGRFTYWRPPLSESWWRHPVGGTTSVRCTDEHDTSPVQTRYDGQCTLCWLGHPHTEAAHAQKLGRGAA